MMKTRKFVHILKGKNGIFHIRENPHSYLGLKESYSELMDTWHYLCYDRDSLLFLDSTDNGLFEEFGKGSRRRLMQPGAMYMLGKDSVWDFKTKDKNQQ